MGGVGWLSVVVFVAAFVLNVASLYNAVRGGHLAHDRLLLKRRIDCFLIVINTWVCASSVMDRTWIVVALCAGIVVLCCVEVLVCNRHLDRQASL